MSSLSPVLRRQLEKAVREARTVAEEGARKALEALAVHEPDPYRHMDEGQRNLRRRLRAQARQLGDGESQTKRGAYEIGRLVEKLAYDQWHRLLFARFLLENNLLMSPEHGVAVTLDDCEELAPSLGLKDAWGVAAQFASKELPEIFRADDPAGAVDMPVEDRKVLVRLVNEQPVDVFTASDSIGWCYQFWQAERKDEVNAAGAKIGAEELPAVTQLFTEDYMVDFLLDNTLGAWHAAKILAANPRLATAEREEELRQGVSLAGCQWKHLRFTRGAHGRWTPAAGSFAGWPSAASGLKCLDPCMGSGHFVVAMFERCVALRMAEEGLEERDAVTAVIRDNLFGLELDPRCTQIGAFNLALAAWRRVGHCKLPAMNIACSGLAPNMREAEWLAVAGDDQRLRAGMEGLYRLFKDAPVLGSLINPRAGAGDLLVAEFQELQPLLEKARAQEAKDEAAHETVLTARGVVKAAEILVGQFTLVATNVPYLGSGRQDHTLREYCERFHPDARADLATCFVDRCLEFCDSGGSSVLVTPQNWLFLGSYKKFRQRMLEEVQWNVVARLGEHAFDSPQAAGAFVVLLSLTRARPASTHAFVGLDVADHRRPETKAARLLEEEVRLLQQQEQTQNPDARIVLEAGVGGPRLNDFADSFLGLGTGDFPHYGRTFWELPAAASGWSFHQVSVYDTCDYGGRECLVAWDFSSNRVRGMEAAEREQIHNQDQSGQQAWGKKGVAVALMRQLKVTLYTGERHEKALTVLIPKDPKHLPALWACCTDPDFNTQVRKLDQKVIVANATVAKIPFDLAHWKEVAARKFPHGLPAPFSSDATQWLFDGHPKQSDHPLQVAVARLVGYQWPRQAGSSFPDCPALGPDGLAQFADDDGIVCLAATKGEAAAAERLREVLARAWGSDWNAAVLDRLLSQAGYAGETLEDWLRNGFFEYHCKVFHDRPFIWQIWDGHKSGFSALVNYHRLDHAGLEKLTYAYLGDWIRRQQASVDAGEPGSDARLEAAKALQVRLKLILEGEPPYDLFVRWKPLSKQAIGWHPDINDGVRLNIRPFMAEDFPGGKKGAGILRSRPNIKWEKDRGKEPERERKDFPWFWGWDEEKQDFAGVGKEPDGNRWNSCHYSNEFKKRVRESGRSR
jgi:hypothetical protein